MCRKLMLRSICTNNINSGYVCDRKWYIKDGSLNLENIEAGSKQMKKVFFFKEGKKQYD